ncbi:MAG: ATP-binding protein [Candidatus Krumholzibacteria bacterium]|nr:ATP-binding protein [Candidatus Krumholzibacteria bacterium]
MIERAAQPVRSDRGFFISDTDFDGNDELILDAGNELIRYGIGEGALRISGSLVYPYEDGRTMGLADVTGDGCPEFFVQTIRPEGLYLTCHDWHARNASVPLFKRGPFFPDQKKLKSFEIGSAEVFGAVDADGDSAQEAFIDLNCNYSGLYCRSLFVCRPNPAVDLWKYDMGPTPTGGGFLSVPNDTPLVVVSTFAPCNGTSCNGTADSVAYIFCFKGYNRLLWKTRTSGAYTWNNVRLADLDADGHDEIIVSRKFEDGERRLKRVEDLWSIAVLDSSDGHMVRQAALGSGVAGFCAADLDGDNVPEIIAGAQDGRLYILDNRLRLIRTSPDARQNTIGDGVIDVRDLNGDGNKEIVCRGATEILIRNDEGRLIAEKDINATPILAVATAEGRRYIVAEGIDKGVVRIFELEKEAKALGKEPWLFAFIGILAGFMGTYLFSLSRVRASKRSSNLAFSDEAYHDLLVGLSAFEHGGSSLAILRRLQFRLVNWDRRKDLADEGPDEFESLVESFRGTVVADLKHIMILARKAKVPIKTPKSLFESATLASGSLGALMAADDPGAPEDQSKRAAAALSILQEIDTRVSALRAHMRTVFRARTAESIGRALDGNLGTLHAMGIEPKLHVIDSFDDAAFVSPLLFEKVLDNLISNAIAAMEHGEGRSLEIFLRGEGAYLLIDVKDGGAGMRKEDWERIFERAVTTKEGGGFGLHYSREELAKFGGKIFVQESAPDRGTTFRIILRKA